MGPAAGGWACGRGLGLGLRPGPESGPQPGLGLGLRTGPAAGAEAPRQRRVAVEGPRPGYEALVPAEPDIRHASQGEAVEPRLVGVVIHPAREIDVALGEVRTWAREQGVGLGQIAYGSEGRRVADAVEVERCELVVALGGDGTSLAAIRAAGPHGIPVLGVACGSLGALTGVAAEDTADALRRVSEGDWLPRELPALDVRAEDGTEAIAYNDLVVLRKGEGQVRVAAVVDGELFARFAGDGCIVSTPVGSSAYTMAAGGPLLPPGLQAYAVTALPAHGGSRPPLVVDGGSELTLASSAGFGGARLEIDGQGSELKPDRLTVRMRERAATVVRFADSEPLFSGLRRRGIISDSPRILIEDEKGEGRLGIEEPN